MASVTVVIGFAEALSAPEVAWSLVDAGWIVIAFARKGRKAALRHSKHVTVWEITAPEVDFRQSVRDLQERIETFHGSASTERHVLFPLDDSAVYLCDKMSLPSGWVLAGPTGSAVEFALDKSIQLDFAKAAGWNVPDTLTTTSVASVLAKATEVPLTLRPSRAVNLRSNRLVKGSNWICANNEELESVVTQWHEDYPLLVQPFISGVGEGIFGLSINGSLQALSAHRRLRMMNPHGSGSSACVSESVPDGVERAVEKLIAKAGWTGLFMIELLRDRAGELWFIEFNGRPWGSIALSRRRGLEYPAWMVEMVLNSEWRLRDSPPVDSSSVVCRNLGREFVHLLFVLRGPKSTAIESWPSFWRSAVAVCGFDGEDHAKRTFYNWRRDDQKVFWADCCYTICDQVFKRKR